MRKIIVFFMLFFISGCSQSVPEELIPFMGYWDLVEHTEYGDFAGYFFFDQVASVNINDVGCVVAYGTELVGSKNDVRINYYGMPIEDYPGDTCIGETTHVVLENKEFSPSGDFLDNTIYCFKFVDDNHITGAYRGYHVIGISTIGTFDGKRRD